jgi:hypothetical protein
VRRKNAGFSDRVQWKFIKWPFISFIVAIPRLELTSDRIAPSLGEQLKSLGVFTEIISWKTRYFIPNHEVKAPKVIEAVRALF